ncbi:FHA domain-containing protein [Rhodococcus oryzae]|uniref:FHA domain-containing protein n=1 Tax=Rhodococcus oryzae TaxID=2571143 RepID=UPI00371CE4F5
MSRIERARLNYRDGQGHDRDLTLSASALRVTVGRSHRSDVALSWDRTVSRLHAAIEWTSTHWAIIDDGLSRNGTFVNGERLDGRRRLRSGDIIRIGATTITFHGRDRPGLGGTEVRVFIATLAENRIIFDRESALAYLSDLPWRTEERLKREAHGLADRLRRSMPARAGECVYYAFGLTSTGDLLEKLSLSMMVIQEADAAGALPAPPPFTGLAHTYTSVVRELSKALALASFPASTPGCTGYLIISSDVIKDMAALFEAFGSLLLDHGYRPERALRGEDPLLLATKAIARASALRSHRR